MSENTRPRVRALCCECGNLRTVSSNWSFRRDDNKTCDDDDRRHPGRFWRMTGTLKCATCKRSTRHAILRDDDIPEHRDGAERHAQPRVRYVVRSDRAEAPAHGYRIVERRTLQPGDLLHGRPVEEVVRWLGVVNASGDQIASAFGYEAGWHVETSCAVSKAVGMDNVFSLAHGLWVHFEDQAVNWLEMFGRLCANGSGS